MTNKLAGLLRSAAHAHRDRTALICSDRRLTFAQTEDLSNRLANGLLAMGLKKGDRAAILSHNAIEFVCTDFALIKAGLVRVPVNPRLAPPEIEYIVRDCGASVLLHDPSLSPALPNARPFTDIPQDNDEPVAVDVTDGDPYMILYTSGTTGRPKGAVTNLRSRWVTLFHVYANELFITRDDVMLHAASLAHGSGTKVLPFYLKGAANVLMPKFSVGDFCRLVEQERVTATWLVPTAIGMLLDAPERLAYDLRSLKTMIYAGAPMPAERLEEALRAFGQIFVQVYGLSEAPQPDLVLPKEEHVPGSPRLASAGCPALGVEVRVDAKPGQIGEILLRGEHTMTGYWGRPAETAEVLSPDGWFRTGDLARVDEDGFIYIVDRARELIITGGYNVYPREVEEALYRHPAVREAAVIGVPDPVWGEAVKACVALRPGAAATADELIACCAGLLAGYKKPRSVDFFAELPKSPTGKILKKALRAPYWQGRDREVN